MGTVTEIWPQDSFLQMSSTPSTVTLSSASDFSTRPSSTPASSRYARADSECEAVADFARYLLTLDCLQVDSMRVLASQIVAYHFCQSDNSPTCLVPEFVHSVAAQLSQAPQLTPYYELVNSDPELQNLLSLPGCVSDPSAAFVAGILEPLHNLRR